MPFLIDKATILKYDVQGPRYTSYPTAPEWSADVDAGLYRQKLAQFGRSQKTLSLYIHIPFCEQLCYFCACMKVIRTADEKHGEEYLNFLFKEIELVSSAIASKPVVKQPHWGGGTPTFLSEAQMRRLFKKITDHFVVDLNGEIAIEVDPRTVTPSKLEVLRELGFNRISMGVQDFDPTVMESVNRVQPFEMVEQVTTLCRQLGFHSINFDLIYGLPHQTLLTFQKTMTQVLELKPDRIALYSFAYVPWLQKHQTKLVENDFPTSDAKLDIFLDARTRLLDFGYQPIAMDHFALESDEMTKAFRDRQLYRNFMGYTVKPADEYIGLGVSAIGFLENTFIHTTKALPDYYQALSEGKLPVHRGKVLSDDDRRRRWVILELMCHFAIDKNEFQNLFHQEFDDYFTAEQDHLKDCTDDGLIVVTKSEIEVTELGQFFIRNVCMGFDAYLRKTDVKRRFSRTV